MSRLVEWRSRPEDIEWCRGRQAASGDLLFLAAVSKVTLLCIKYHAKHMGDE